MFQMPVSSSAVAEMFQADVLKEDEKWYPHSTLGKLRPLMFDLSGGSCVTLLKVDGGGTLGKHYHSAAVSAWTLDGAWGYREYEWVARAGSFVYEPPGHTHTLYVHPSENKMLVLFQIQGPLIYLDDKNNPIDYADAFTHLERYREYCLRTPGLGEEWVRSLIR